MEISAEIVASKWAHAIPASRRCRLGLHRPRIYRDGANRESPTRRDVRDLLGILLNDKSTRGLGTESRTPSISARHFAPLGLAVEGALVEKGLLTAPGEAAGRHHHSGRDAVARRDPVGYLVRGKGSSMTVGGPARTKAELQWQPYL